MGRRLNLETAAKLILGRERNSYTEQDGRKHASPKVSLPKVHFLDRPLPDWFSEPPPSLPSVRKKRRGE
jgi:hypothetical protein